MHRLLLHNDDIRETQDRLLAAGQVGLLNGWGVFSTLRVIDGVLYAYPRHWARMRRDAALLHVPMPPSAAWLEERLLRLVAANEAFNSTLRVAIVRNQGGMFEGPGMKTEFDAIAFTKELKDWGTEAKLALAPKTRHADTVFAGTKMLSWSFNLVLLEDALAQGYDEVLLLNERGEVSECTSANIFAVFGNRVVTPPLASGCLPGVTRAVILEELAAAGIEKAEETLLPMGLERADELFITSSTRELLPVSHVEGLALRLSAARPVQTALLGELQKNMRAYAAKGLQASAQK